MKSKQEIVLEHCDGYYPQDGYVDLDTQWVRCPLDKIYAAMEAYAVEREMLLKLKYGILPDDNYTTLNFITNKLNNI